jgi:hypothetical protein
MQRISRQASVSSSPHGQGQGQGHSGGHASALDVSSGGFIASRVSSEGKASASAPAAALAEGWPAIDPAHHDVHLGALLPAEVVSVMVRWTLHGSSQA